MAKCESCAIYEWDYVCEKCYGDFCQNCIDNLYVNYFDEECKEFISNDLLIGKLCDNCYNNEKDIYYLEKNDKQLEKQESQLK